MRFLSFILVVYFLWIGSLVAQDSKNKDVVSSLITIQGEYYLERVPDFKIIFDNSIRSLGKYEINNDLMPVKKLTPEKILPELKANKIKHLFTFDINFVDDDEAIVTIEVFDSQTRQKTLHWSKEYDFDNINPFISYLQYEIPLNLKLQLKSLGRVISKETRLIFLDLGSLVGVQKGDIYRVFREGRALENDDGDLFGRIDDIVGIVEIKGVTNFYSSAEIIIGKISIQGGDFVEKIVGASRKKFVGKVDAIFEDKVSITLGKNVGVREGSYYAVFKDIKVISEDDAFRENIGSIKIDEVFEDHSRGLLSLSDYRNISKVLLSKGMVVEEIESPHKDTFTLGLTPLNISGGEGNSLTSLTYQVYSDSELGKVFRFRLGKTEDDGMAGIGIKSSIANSPNFFMGIDALFLDGVVINAFIGSAIPISLIEGIRIDLEVGYLGGSNTSDYNGLAVNLGLKVPFSL
ncbi:MAG: hypothetical protein COB67_12670 [SAR324 cluster bacterium]|uniref:Uncharacterized protein n=1 Tax=SAR324 cluster bacterium TaxID=2024889 RepID=A0A2A4SRJ5_9DELT|nr:MAG: hypothetical protein COB67_12670 [SAR324 cluster bacterium]